MNKNTDSCCEYNFSSLQFCTPLQASTLLRENRQLFLFIRHGMTKWNMECRLQGRKNIPLSDVGKKQAELCAQRLENILKAHKIKGIYSSPLDRAIDSANVISEALGTNTVAVDSLIERDYGSLEGLTYEDRKKMFKKPSDYPTDMESIADTTARIKHAIGSIRRLDGDGCCIIVSHGGVLNCLFSAITVGRAGGGSRFCANCTVSLAAVGLRDIIPLAFNLTGEELSAYMDSLIN